MGLIRLKKIKNYLTVKENKYNTTFKSLILGTAWGG